MTHQWFLENKESLEKAFYDAMFAHLSKLTLEELKQIDWFTVSDKY